ncbi:hypothetical protein PENSPDRAFT_651620 [Peniophora sp. CONT]|nr:hypothetical protein PENSPDRAFT_651620 [Peniophora sp. CONT]
MHKDLGVEGEREVIEDRHAVYDKHFIELKALKAVHGDGAQGIDFRILCHVKRVELIKRVCEIIRECLEIRDRLKDIDHVTELGPCVGVGELQMTKVRRENRAIQRNSASIEMDSTKIVWAYPRKKGVREAKQAVPSSVAAFEHFDEQILQ